MATTTPRRLLVALLGLLALLGLVAGCGSDDDDATRAGTAVTGDITVLAAASLTESFTALGRAFSAAHPDATVTFAFGASSTLVQQLIEGAPADVFASADVATMAQLTDADLAAGTPTPFASNALEIIVPRGNPAGIATVADLAAPGIAVVTCAPEVPIGRYTQQVLDQAGITVTPKSLEENVKALVAKVSLGEADAGIVYATDVAAAGGTVEGVEIPAAINVVATYPIAVTADAAAPDVAEAFVAFVAGPEGQAVLRGFGFAPA